jgi:hypothetical protein
MSFTFAHLSILLAICLASVALQARKMKLIHNFTRVGVKRHAALQAFSPEYVKKAFCMMLSVLEF